MLSYFFKLSKRMHYTFSRNSYSLTGYTYTDDEPSQIYALLRNKCGEQHIHINEFGDSKRCLLAHLTPDEAFSLGYAFCEQAIMLEKFQLNTLRDG